MENRSFYRNLSRLDCEKQSDEEPLLVNCAGACAFTKPFQTWNREGREDYYLQFVNHGTLSIWVGDALREMQVGDFLLTRPRTPYRYAYPAAGISPEKQGEMGYLWVHFTGFHAGRLLSRLQLEPGQIYHTTEETTEIEGAFDTLFTEFTIRERGFDDACAATLTRLLVCLSRAVSMGTEPTRRPLTTLAWLHGHFTENVSMGELAAMEHLSESRYRSVFHEQTGMSPSEYRIALRMKHACDLLSTSTRSISDISAACGYSDVLYFTRLFKQRIGIPPGEYRNRSFCN